VVVRIRASRVALAATVAVIGSVVGLLGQAGDRTGGPVAGTAEKCLALQTAPGTLPNPTTAVTSATLNPSDVARPLPNSTPPVPALPEHCEITGKVNERVGVNGQRYAINLTLGAAALSAIFETPPVPTASTGGPAAYALGIEIDRAFRALSTSSGAYRTASRDFMKADSTDLSMFRNRGGKLLIAHGVSDPIFSILDTINWWKDVDRVNGGRADRFVRLFAVPGMNHCAGGPSTDQFDAFGALVGWVENGSAPDRIVATARSATPWPGRTRPLCAYPKQARYAGNGSIEDADSFVCR
jgi:feruloyl esterase